MATIKFTRGCVYQFDPSSGGGGSGAPSIIKVSPPISKYGESPVLLVGVQTSEQDLVLPVVTLDNLKIMYTFGEDFGAFNIIGTALLGSAGGNGDALGSAVKWFAANRVTRKKAPIQVSLGGGGSYQIFVTGLNIAEADTEFHIQPFVITGQIAKAP